MNKKKEPKLSEKEINENRQILKNMMRKQNFLKNPRYRQLRKCLLYNTEEFKDLLSKENPFAVDPNIIVFRDYQPNVSYSMIVSIINRTHLLNNFKYVGPKTKFFKIKGIVYPKVDSGDIAPGMRAKIEIEFKHF